MPENDSLNMSGRTAGERADSYAQWAGVANNAGTAVVGGFDKSGSNAIHSDGTVESVTGSLGPWGAAFTGLSNMFAGIGSAVVGEEVKPGEKGYEHYKKKAEIGNAGTAIAKPLSAYKSVRAQQDMLTDEEKGKFANTAGGGALLAFVAPGVLGQQKAKNDAAVAERKYEFESSLKDKQDSFKGSQERINKSSSRYANAMAEAYYSANIPSARRGMVLERYERKRLSVEKPTVDSFKNGGVTKKKKSIIPKGAFHHTQNKLGDKGIPVVDKNGVKVFEIETIELILDKDVSDETLKLTNLYNETGDEKYLYQIGELTSEELVKNTYSYADEYSCLNTNSCTL